MPVTLSPSCVQPTASSRHRRQQQRREKEANARREREAVLAPCCRAASLSKGGGRPRSYCEATVSVSYSVLSLILVPLLCTEVAAAVMVAVGLHVLKQSCYCCCSIPLFFSSFKLCQYHYKLFDGIAINDSV
ncbi:uncharacterized protein DS421_12g375890 [Arachis hypogaea]|nr:uncharacterized protein DS421_12g375890 [Arachis hypogaea]